MPSLSIACLLKTGTFPGRVNLRFGDICGPKDHLCYYFLWGYLQTLNEPNEAIRDKHWLQSMMTRELANFI